VVIRRTHRPAVPRGSLLIRRTTSASAMLHKPLKVALSARRGTTTMWRAGIPQLAGYSATC